MEPAGCDPVEQAPKPCLGELGLGTGYESSSTGILEFGTVNDAITAVLTYQNVEKEVHGSGVRTGPYKGRRDVAVDCIFLPRWSGLGQVSVHIEGCVELELLIGEGVVTENHGRCRRLRGIGLARLS